jgi:hypothetical protein
MFNFGGCRAGIDTNLGCQPAGKESVQLFILLLSRNVASLTNGFLFVIIKASLAFLSYGNKDYRFTDFLAAYSVVLLLAVSIFLLHIS